MEETDIGHRAGTLTRPGSKVRDMEGPRGGGHYRKAGVSLVRRERGGRAFHVKGTTCWKLGSHAETRCVWGTGNRTGCHSSIEFIVSVFTEHQQCVQ